MSNNLHIVKKKENLSTISRKYGITVKEIIALNPNLRENPHLIYPGTKLKIPSHIKYEELGISSMLFNGKALIIYSKSNKKKIAEYSAISGLPPYAPYLKKLIKKGRKDLDIKNNYTLPKYQNVKDAGPIQEDNYTLPLKQDMPFDKSKAAGDSPGWGVGGWILKENFFAKLGNVFGGRFGFFLHHDGGARGTAGCIGLKYAKNMIELKQILVKAQLNGQESVRIDVKYNQK